MRRQLVKTGSLNQLEIINLYYAITNSNEAWESSTNINQGKPSERKTGGVQLLNHQIQIKTSYDSGCGSEVSRVNAGTTGRHLRYLAHHGVLDIEMLHPAHHYKLSSNAESVELTQELERLAAVLGG